MSNRKGGYIGNDPISWKSNQYSGVWSVYQQYEEDKEGNWLGKPFDLDYARYTGVSTSTQTVSNNTQSISSKSDGSSLFMLSSKGGAEGVVRIDLAENWNLSTASNVGVASTAVFVLNVSNIPAGFTITKDVSLQDANPRGLEISSDGTRLYICGQTNDKVYQYDLSTAWNISSATFDTDFLTSSIAGLNPTAIGFNTDGSQLFVCGASGLGQYFLSTPYDIGTVNTTPNPVSVSSQDGNPYGIYINPSGEKVYISGIANDRIYQYSLSSSWGLPSLTYDNVFFSVTSQGTDPSSVEFKDDGTKMYVLLLSNNTIFQYTLGTPWDISTAGLTTSFSVSSEETTPEGIRIGNNGQNLYLVGRSGDDVNQYALGTQWDISTAGFVTNFSVSGSGETNPTGLYFKNDGESFYVIGTQIDSVLKYNMGTPWDISTAGFVTSFSVTAEEISPQDLYFSPDGLKMHVLGSTGDDITTYKLSTAWNPSTAGIATYISTPVSAGSLIGVSVGSSTISTFGGSDRIDQYTYSYSNLTYVGSSGVTTSSANTGFTFIDDGKKFVVVGNDYFREYRPTSLYNAAQVINTSEGLFVKPEEDKLYVIDNTNDEIVQFSTETAGNISFLNVEHRLSIASSETDARDIFFKPEGDKMYVVGSNGDDVNEYSLSNPWDISSAGFTTNFSVASQDTDPRAIFFKPEGDKMYVVGNAGDDVNEYSLSNPWDISSAGFTTNFSVLPQTTPESIAFTNDGTLMFIGGNTPTEIIDVYVLESPWDISTAKIFYSKNINDASPTAVSKIAGLRFSSNGSTLYVSDNKQIVQYELPKPWSIARVYLKNINDIEKGCTEIDVKSTRTYSASVLLQDVRISSNNQEYFYGVGGTSVIQGKLFSKNTLMTAILSNPTAMSFSPDGKQFFVHDSTYGVIMKFSLDTPYDLYNPSNVYSNGCIALNGNLMNFAPAVTGISMSNDGKTLYTVGTTSDALIPIYFSNEDYITFASLPLKKSVNFTSVDNTMDGGFFIRNDGKKMYLLGRQYDRVYQYDLDIPFDITSLTGITTSFSVAAKEVNPFGIEFKNDGTKMYIAGNNDAILEYSLSTPWEISSAGYASSIATNTLNPISMRFKPDGTKLFVRGSGYTDEYSLSSPWDITTAGITTRTVKSANQGYGLNFDVDGKNVYVIWTNNEDIVQLELEKNWDIGSISIPGISSCNCSLGSLISLRDFYITPRKERLEVDDPVGFGTNTYLTGGHAIITMDSLDTMRQFILPHSIYNRSPKISVSNPGDGGFGYDNQINDTLTNATTFDSGISILRQDTNSSSLGIIPDNTKIFMTGRSNDIIVQYKINDPENIEAGITYEKFIYVGAGTSQGQTNPYGVTFSPDGTIMYSAGQNPAEISEYKISNKNNK